MNIYEFKHSLGETDWVCAPNIKEAKKFYKNETGSTDLPRKVTKKELSQTYLLDVNEDEPDWDDYEGEDIEEDFCNGYKIIETFEEYLKTAKSIELMASTTYL